ncbi:MAG: succinylglutamate-semialdehyde dehydrogenase [Planctomycetota bacterium]
MTTSADLSVFVAGQWTQGRGELLASKSPLDDKVFWSKHAASHDDVRAAIDAARLAQPAWEATPLADREAALRRFADIAASRKDAIAQTIHREMGKPIAEAEAEAGAIVGKVQLTIDAYNQRRAETTIDMAGKTGRTWYKAIGVVGVLGPFNFPMHLPAGHIIPALLSGNTVVFKPSEITPACGEMLASLMNEAGLPDGVLNLVQGGREVGQALAEDRDVNGLLFTGGSMAGKALQRSFGETPERILALELGGNNPIVVHQPGDIDAAVADVITSAFVTSGQRCTCARRLIVTPDSRHVVDRIVEEAAKLDLAPVATERAAASVIDAQRKLEDTGGNVLLRAARLEDRGRCYVSPGVIDVTNIDAGGDDEVFGPLLQVVRVGDLDEAIKAANATRYGLAAGLISADDDAWQKFRREVRAGIINRNTPITGASGKLPFGGVGESGNFRPSGFFAVDYCSYPVASVEA